MKLKLLDLFSGIGGFSLGFESTGFFETIGFVEKDKFCQKVLKKNWSNINIEEDIRNVKGERYAADVVTGGFPCQPFSVAGKRKSTTDDRYLWDEMLRVIREVKPSWIVAENVEGIVNINEGMVLRQVLNDLENEGFKSQCIIIPASGIGAWHQRKRIWIISNSNARLSIRENKEIQTGRNTINNGSQDVSNSDSRMCGGRGTELKSGDDREWRFYSTQEEQTREHIRCKTIGCNAILGKERTNKTWWQTQSEFCGVPNGVSYELDKDRSNRIKALGNSIVPQIARQIGLAIKEVELNGH
jgi:DNA (cytosine-5)-methyltransferase 1